MSGETKLRTTQLSYNMRHGVSGDIYDQVYQDNKNFQIQAVPIMWNNDVKQSFSSINPNDEIVIRVPPSYRILGKVWLELTLGNPIKINNPHNFIAHQFLEVVRYRVPGCERIDLRPEYSVHQILSTSGSEDLREQYRSLAGKAYTYYPAGYKFYCLVPLPNATLMPTGSKEGSKPWPIHLTTESLDLTIRIADLTYKHGKFNGTSMVVTDYPIVFSNASLVWNYAVLGDSVHYKQGPHRHVFQSLYGYKYVSPAIIIGGDKKRVIDLHGIKPGETSQFYLQFKPELSNAFGAVKDLGGTTSISGAKSSVKIFIGKFSKSVVDITSVTTLANTLGNALKYSKDYWMYVSDPNGELTRRDYTQDIFYGSKLKNFKLFLSGQNVWDASDGLLEAFESTNNSNENCFWNGKINRLDVRSHTENFIEDIKNYPSHGSIASGYIGGSIKMVDTNDQYINKEIPVVAGHYQDGTVPVGAGSVDGFITENRYSEDWIVTLAENGTTYGGSETGQNGVFSCGLINIQNTITGEILQNVNIYRHMTGAVASASVTEIFNDVLPLSVGNGFSLPILEKRKSRFYQINLSEMYNRFTQNTYQVGVDFTNSHVKIEFEVDPERDETSYASNHSDPTIQAQLSNIKNSASLNDPLFGEINYNSDSEAYAKGSVFITQSLTSIFEFRTSTVQLIQ